MSRLRWPACLLVLCPLALPVAPADAGDQVELRVSLVLVDACTIHAFPGDAAAPPRVDCSSDQPYRVEERPAPPEGDDADRRVPGPAGLTILF